MSHSCWTMWDSINESELQNQKRQIRLTLMYITEKFCRLDMHKFVHLDPFPLNWNTNMESLKHNTQADNQSLLMDLGNTPNKAQIRIYTRGQKIRRFLHSSVCTNIYHWYVLHCCINWLENNLLYKAHIFSFPFIIWQILTFKQNLWTRNTRKSRNKN